MFRIKLWRKWGGTEVKKEKSHFFFKYLLFGKIFVNSGSAERKKPDFYKQISMICFMDTTLKKSVGADIFFLKNSGFVFHS